MTNGHQGHRQGTKLVNVKIVNCSNSIIPPFVVKKFIPRQLSNDSRYCFINTVFPRLETVVTKHFCSIMPWFQFKGQLLIFYQGCEPVIRYCITLALLYNIYMYTRLPVYTEKFSTENANFCLWMHVSFS